MTTYKSSGVDVNAADNLVSTISSLAKLTYKSSVMAGVGGFGSVFDLKMLGMKDPLLVTTTDGVGTKLLLAIEADNYAGIGQDLVAMCVNDLIATGATPTVFLDYYATGQLDKDVAAKIIKSIAHACLVSNCSLVGGETAEMPGLYKPGHLDLAGFAVGFVERDNLLPKTLAKGNAIIGLPSNGIHSNGFSLIRKMLDEQGLKHHNTAPWDNSVSIGDSLLTPTEIYTNMVLGIQKLGILKAAAHITGGGIASNLSRVIDDNHKAVIETLHHTPRVYEWLLNSGVAIDELFEVFNCGIGMILVVDNEKEAMDMFDNNPSRACVIGYVDDRVNDEPKVIINRI